MIYFDVTKTGAPGHRSGLNRVGVRLREELGAAARGTSWPWPREIAGDDWLLTSELFSEEERPGIANWLERRPCRAAAIFHDAIPLKFPAITWPQSVARHPGYMKLLARFDRIWAVSASSRSELVDFWRWQGVETPPPVDLLTLGADFDRAPRATSAEGNRPLLLCVGIIEPRKNQAFLLRVAERLWREGLDFELHLVGRVNPYFGAPIAAEVRRVAARFKGLHFHEAADDAELARLYHTARATVFPSIAEGCGLPLLESLWRGVPCLASDLPSLRDNAAAGGCVLVAPGDEAAWCGILRRFLTDADVRARLAAEAAARPLPTWADAARALRETLG